MAGYLSMAAADAESFRKNIQAIVSESLDDKLRQDEELKTYDRAREEKLRQVPESVKAFTWFTEQNQAYDAKCREYFDNVRPELHHAIDVLIDKLEEEFLTGPYGQKEAELLRTPQAPRTASNGFPIRLSQLDTFGPSQPRAPEAAMDALSGRASSRTRSETMLAEDLRPAVPRDRLTDYFTHSDVGGNATDSGSPSDPVPPRACADILSAAPDVSSASKRQSGDEAAREGNNKRQRRSLLNNHDVPSESERCPGRPLITLSQVKPDECIFRYKKMPGFYVLRCNRKKCKPSRERNRFTNDPYYFRAHPFKWNRALNHFGGPGHDIKLDDAIFQSYACEVSDAIEERNLSSPKARQPQTPKTPNSELTGPSDAAPEQPAAMDPLTLMSPSTSRDKGKQPASVVELDLDEDDDSLFVGEQSSGSVAAEALPRSQPYPTRNRVSIPDGEIMEIDENDHVENKSDQDSSSISSEEEFDIRNPPLAKWPKAARRFAPS